MILDWLSQRQIVDWFPPRPLPKLAIIAYHDTGGHRSIVVQPIAKAKLIAPMVANKRRYLSVGASCEVMRLRGYSSTQTKDTDVVPTEVSALELADAEEGR